MIEGRLQEFREELSRFSQLGQEQRDDLSTRMRRLSWQELSVLRREFDPCTGGIDWGHPADPE